ncbi:hypothetical protein EDB89DRAFT_1996179, partial [Lactarius sanguifluus]
SSSVAREGCTPPPNPRTGELGSSPSLSGLRLPPPPSTYGSIGPLPAYSPAPVSVLGTSTTESVPGAPVDRSFAAAIRGSKVKAQALGWTCESAPTSPPAPGLWSTPSCSGITKPSMGPSGWSWVPAVRSSGGGGCGGTTSSSTPWTSASASTGPASRDVEVEVEIQTRVLQIIGIGCSCGGRVGGDGTSTAVRDGGRFGSGRSCEETVRADRGPLI